MSFLDILDPDPAGQLSQALYVIGDWTLPAAAFAVLAFIVSYAGFFRWRKNPAGRALMQFLIALDLVLWLNGLAVHLGPDYFGREWIRLVVYLYLFINTIRMLTVLWRQLGNGAVTGTTSERLSALERQVFHTRKPH